MRINVYTEELETTDSGKPMAEVVTAKYISSRTGKDMTNYGVRIFLKSPNELHYIPGRDDDRSAVTFWCGDSIAKAQLFLNDISYIVDQARPLKI